MEVLVVKEEEFLVKVKVLAQRKMILTVVLEVIPRVINMEVTAIKM